jgi:hypothetical protein
MSEPIACPFFCPAHKEGHPEYDEVEVCRTAIYEGKMERARAARAPIPPTPAEPDTSPVGHARYSSTLAGPKDGPDPVCARCGRPSRGVLVSDARGRLVHERCNRSGLA